MDTKKLLEEKNRKFGNRFKNNARNDESSGDEADFMIFTDQNDKKGNDFYLP